MPRPPATQFTCRRHGLSLIRALVLILVVALGLPISACSGPAGNGAGTGPGSGSPDSSDASTGPSAQKAPNPPGAEPAATQPEAGSAAVPLTDTAGSAAGGGAMAPANPMPLAAAGTGLRTIQDRGKLIVGVKYDVPTFGYLNPMTNQLEGFDVDLARGIARHIFGRDDAIDFAQAVSANRIPFLEQSTVDLVASTMTANAERAQQIDFTRAYYVAGQALLVPQASTVNGLADLKGKTVCSAQGSTSEKNIRAKAPEASVVLFPTYAECVQAMDSGRADAVTTDDNILLGFVKLSPGKYRVPDERFTVEPYAMGVKKGNAELLAAANEALEQMMTDGTWAQLYSKNLPGAAVPPVPPANWQDVK